MIDPIRVFVGCSANTEDAEAQAVLEYTIQEHASRPVRIEWMRLSRDPESPYSGWDISAWSTPFSGFRWSVPKLAGFEGRAVYVDVDFIFLADVAELHDADMGDAAYLSDNCTGIMLWDCERGAEQADPVRGPLPGKWNCKDCLPNGAKAVHCTALWSQPHMHHAQRRLARRGLSHWNERPQRPHPRVEVSALFEWKLAEAELYGYPVARYENEADFPRFGDYGSPARLAS